MAIDPRAFQPLFLEELGALDAFSQRREKTGALPVGAEDPDVQRLLEALAFFAARTRAAAAAETRLAVERMVSSVLDDLVSPMPAAAMLRVNVDERLVEPKLLRRGAVLQATNPDGQMALFTTERPLALLPLRIPLAKLVTHRKGLALEITIAATSRAPLQTPLELPLYVRRLGDYEASLALLDAIETHFLRATLVLDPDTRPAGLPEEEIPCAVGFGAGRAALDEDDEEASPLGRIRAFLQNPERDAFLRLRLPRGAPFHAATVRLWLGDEFPEDLGVTADNFQPFVVPVSNLFEERAAPILCDGTRDTYPLRCGATSVENVEMHSVRGVYLESDKGKTPISPAALSLRGDSFELGKTDAGDPELSLHLEAAFEAPRRVSVDARWHQPELFDAFRGKLAVTLHRRMIAGASFGFVGPIHAPEPSPLATQATRLLHVLAKRARPLDDVRDLAGLLELCGAAGRSAYRDAPGLIAHLERREAPDPGAGVGRIKHVYRLGIRDTAPEKAPLTRKLVALVAALCDAWTEGTARVEVEAEPEKARLLALERGGT